MKKRIFAMLLALVMVISMLPLAAYAAEEECPRGGSHSWRDGMGTRYCNKCYTTCNHEGLYNAATGTCTRCGMTCSHQKSNGFWGSESAFVNGVCSVCDYKCPHTNYGGNNKCSVCKMEKVNHQHTYRSSDGKCTVSGCNAVCPHAEYDSATGKCKECQMTCTHPVKNGSAWNNGVCKTCGKTCLHENGYNQSTHKCNTCGRDCQHTAGYNQNYNCNACGKPCAHEYDRVAATGNCKHCGKTCEHKNYLGDKCATCGMSKHEHTFSSVDGKCTFDGCNAVCSHEYDSTTGKCTECQMQCKHNWKLLRYHEGKEPTCTADGTGAFECEICHKRDGITVPALDHDRVVEVLRAPTCTKFGWQEVGCKREGCTTVVTELLEATGHTKVPITAVPASCTATGLTEGVMCSVCEEILTAQSVAPMVPHTFTVDVPELKATCLKDGYTAHKKCANCDATDGKKEIDTDGHKFVNYVCVNENCGVRDGSCLHTNTGVLTIIDATCKAPGKESFVCTNCGDAYEKVLPQLTTHSFVNGTCSVCGSGTNKCPNHRMTVTERVNATCTTAGYETKVCESCGKVETTTLTSKHNFVNKICTICGHGDTASNKITIDLQDVFAVF